MSLVVLFGVGVLLLGLMFCFAGERMFRFFLALCGAAAGAYGALFLAGDASSPVIVIAALLGAALGIVTALLLYRVSFLLAGCAAGWAVASGLLGLSPLVSALAAAATGLLGFFGARYFMAVATSVWGGAAAVCGARILSERLAGYIPPAEVTYAASGLLALLGTVSQMRRLARRKKGT